MIRIIFYSITFIKRELTLFGFTFVSNRLAARRKMSGAGFPSLSSGSVPLVIWWNSLKTSWWFLVFTATLSSPLLVATQIGTPLVWRCLINCSAPGINSTFAKRACDVFRNSLMNCSSVTFSLRSVTQTSHDRLSVDPRSFTLASGVSDLPYLSHNSLKTFSYIGSVSKSVA